MFQFYLLRRAHVTFLSNIKLRVLAPPIPTSHQTETQDEGSENSSQVLFGDASSTFNSSSYQKYCLTFEQKVPLYNVFSGMRDIFRFE